MYVSNIDITNISLLILQLISIKKTQSVTAPTFNNAINKYIQKQFSHLLPEDYRPDMQQVIESVRKCSFRPQTRCNGEGCTRMLNIELSTQLLPICIRFHAKIDSALPVWLKYWKIRRARFRRRLCYESGLRIVVELYLNHL